MPTANPRRANRVQALERRSFLKTAAAGAAAAALAACDESEPGAPAASSRRFNWRMTTCWPRNLPGLGTGAQLLADTITSASGGRLAVKLYAAGEIVPAFEAMDAVVNGTVEMGHGGPQFWKGKVPAAQFLSNTPFGLTAHEQIAWYQYGGGQAIADEIYAELGCKFFLAGNTGVQMGGWFNKEIHTTGDFKGLKMRLPGLGGEVVKALGATVVNTDPGEITIALQRGALDAADWAGPYADLAFGLYKSAKYYYYPGWHEPSAVLDCFVNRSRFEALPADLQAIIEVSCAAVDQLILSEITAQNNAALNELVTRHNVQLRQFPMEVLTGLSRTAEDVLERIAAADPLSRKVHDSLTAFRREALGWSRISEEAYLAARLLPFKAGPK